METHQELAHQPTKQLLSGVLADVKELAVGHLGRMQGELGDELANLKGYMLAVSIAVGVVVVGAVLAGLAIAFGLATLGLPLWISIGIAAAGMFVLGIVLFRRLPSQTTDIDLVPEESLAKLGEDLRSVTRAVRR